MSDIKKEDYIVKQINTGQTQVDDVDWLGVTDYFCTEIMKRIIQTVDEDKVESVMHSIAQCWYRVIRAYDWRNNPDSVPANLRRSADWTKYEVFPRETLFCPLPPGSPNRSGRTIEDLMQALKRKRQVQPQETVHAKQQEDLPAEVKCVLKNKNFRRETMEGILDACYQDRHCNLALIEMVLFEEKVLTYLSEHKQFLKALLAWGLLDPESNLKKIASGMAAKTRKVNKAKTSNRLNEKDEIICNDVRSLLRTAGTGM